MVVVGVIVVNFHDVCSYFRLPLKVCQTKSVRGSAKSLCHIPFSAPKPLTDPLAMETLVPTWDALMDPDIF